MTKASARRAKAMMAIKRAWAFGSSTAARDHGLIDLDEINRKVAEHLEARVPGADVIESKLEAELPQSFCARDHMVQPCRRALGDLEHDALGVESHPLHGAQEAVAVDRAVDERLGIDVEEQQHVLGQLVCPGERGGAADGVQLVRPADLLGDGKGLGRALETVSRPRAGQRLEAEDLVVLKLPDRLERRLQSRLGQQRRSEWTLSGVMTESRSATSSNTVTRPPPVRFPS